MPTTTSPVPPPGVADDDHRFAAWLATVAGEHLEAVRTSGAEGRALKDAGDLASNTLLMALLDTYRPGDAVLSEEGRDDAGRTAASRVWIVDPLDGTREFSEPPRDDWAVHIALWEDGELAAGAVAQPGLRSTFHTGAPVPVPPRSSPRVRIAVSRTRPPAFVSALAERLDADLVPMGSAGAKVISVVRDVSDAYVHSGGQYEWDSAAPVAVARAAGLFTSRTDGSPLVYNRADPTLPDLWSAGRSSPTPFSAVSPSATDIVVSDNHASPGGSFVGEARFSPSTRPCALTAILERMEFAGYHYTTVVRQAKVRVDLNSRLSSHPFRLAVPDDDKFSTDPELVAKVTDVVGLYLAPPEAVDVGASRQSRPDWTPQLASDGESRPRVCLHWLLPTWSAGRSHREVGGA